MPTRARLGVAIASAFLGAAIVYPILRVALAPSEPDPETVMWSAHSGFFWRAWTSAYAGGAIGFAAWLAPERAARIAARAVVPIAAAVALQAALVP